LFKSPDGLERRIIGCGYGENVPDILKKISIEPDIATSSKCMQSRNLRLHNELRENHHDDRARATTACAAMVADLQFSCG
jgi:hypothetical protein